MGPRTDDGADGEGEGEGQEEPGVDGDPLRQEETRSWTRDGSLLGQKISAPGHSCRLTQLSDHWSRVSER